MSSVWRSRRCLRWAFALVALSSTALAACGSDETESGGAVDGGEPAVCSPFVEVSAGFVGQPDPDRLRALLDDIDGNAPDPIGDELAVLTSTTRTVLDTGDFGPFQSTEFAGAMAAAEAWVFDNCSFATKTQITAEDHRYAGQLSEYPAGRTAFTLVNEGMEAHELLLLRKNDGVTATLEEMMALPESESQTMTTSIGSVFVGPPGDRRNLIVDLEPGDYLAICTVPTGTTVAADGATTEGDGDPHFVLGMSFEFTVSR